MREPKFYDLTIAERLDALSREAQLTPEELAALSGAAGLTPEQGSHMIENVVGIYSLPLGIARNFVVNGRAVPVPMVIEEPSVVAGASFIANMATDDGRFIAEADEPVMIGQMQVIALPNVQAARTALEAEKERLLQAVDGLDPLLQKYGGGPRGVEIRLIEDSSIGPFLVLHLLYDVRDAMGANAINSAVEKLAPLVEEITGGKVLLRILSNLADHRLARARVTIPLEKLAFENYSPEAVRNGIISAWAFAAVDPYRAATHNKGIMNGVDAVVIATGNDWRAVEAGAHAYAARSGRYTSLSRWYKAENGDLAGELEMPIAVGIVGGATRVLPAARAAIKLMGVSTAPELAQVIVSVGLAQNLAALRALATEGIQRGHMGLHARQVAVAAGARPDQVEALAQKMAAEKNIRIDRAVELLKEMY